MPYIVTDRISGRTAPNPISDAQRQTYTDTNRWSLQYIPDTAVQQDAQGGMWVSIEAMQQQQQFENYLKMAEALRAQEASQQNAQQNAQQAAIQGYGAVTSRLGQAIPLLTQPSNLPLLANVAAGEAGAPGLAVGRGLARLARRLTPNADWSQLTTLGTKGASDFVNQAVEGLGGGKQTSAEQQRGGLGPTGAPQAGGAAAAQAAPAATGAASSTPVRVGGVTYGNTPTGGSIVLSRDTGAPAAVPAPPAATYPTYPQQGQVATVPGASMHAQSGQSAWEARRDALLGGQRHDDFQMQHSTTAQELNDIAKIGNPTARLKAFNALKTRPAWTPETSHGSNWRAAGDSSGSPYKGGQGGQRNPANTFDYNAAPTQAFHQPQQRDPNRSLGLTREQQHKAEQKAARNRATGGTDVIGGADMPKPTLFGGEGFGPVPSGRGSAAVQTQGASAPLAGAPAATPPAGPLDPHNPTQSPENLDEIRGILSAPPSPVPSPLESEVRKCWTLGPTGQPIYTHQAEGAGRSPVGSADSAPRQGGAPGTAPAPLDGAPLGLAAGGTVTGDDGGLLGRIRRNAWGDTPVPQNSGEVRVLPGPPSYSTESRGVPPDPGGWVAPPANASIPSRRITATPTSQTEYGPSYGADYYGLPGSTAPPPPTGAGYYGLPGSTAPLPPANASTVGPRPTPARPATPRAVPQPARGGGAPRGGGGGSVTPAAPAPPTFDPGQLHTAARWWAAQHGGSLDDAMGALMLPDNRDYLESALGMARAGEIDQILGPEQVAAAPPVVSAAQTAATRDPDWRKRYLAQQAQGARNLARGTFAGAVMGGVGGGLALTPPLTRAAGGTDLVYAAKRVPGGRGEGINDPLPGYTPGHIWTNPWQDAWYEHTGGGGSDFGPPDASYTEPYVPLYPVVPNAQGGTTWVARKPTMFTVGGQEFLVGEGPHGHSHTGADELVSIQPGAQGAVVRVDPLQNRGRGVPAAIAATANLAVPGSPYAARAGAPAPAAPRRYAAGGTDLLPQGLPPDLGGMSVDGGYGSPELGEPPDTEGQADTLGEQAGGLPPGMPMGDGGGGSPPIIVLVRQPDGSYAPVDPAQLFGDQGGGMQPDMSGGLSPDLGMGGQPPIAAAQGGTYGINRPIVGGAVTLRNQAGPIDKSKPNVFVSPTGQVRVGTNQRGKTQLVPFWQAQPYVDPGQALRSDVLDMTPGEVQGLSWLTQGAKGQDVNEWAALNKRGSAWNQNPAAAPYYSRPF